MKAAKKESPETRAAAMGLLLAMCSRSSADLSEHVPQLIIFVTEAFNDPSDPVCERAWLSLEALVKVLVIMLYNKSEAQLYYVSCVCVYSELIIRSFPTTLATSGRL